MKRREKGKIGTKQNKNLHFDEWLFHLAMNNYETDPYDTITQLSNYLDKYPGDNSARIYYANALATVGKISDALQIVNSCDKVIETSSLYEENRDKYLFQKKDVIFVKIKIYMYMEKYKEAYDLYLNSIDLGISLHIERIIFYCKKKLGLLNSEEREKQYYVNRQILEYNEGDFLYHAKKHCNGYFSNNSEENSEFAPDFPLEEIVKEIKNMIPTSERIYPGFIEDAYLFKYNGCGTCNKGVIDYFKVICFHNTNDIITMYPFLHGERLPQIDINYLKNDKPMVKERKLSQIDKFNLKWKK